MSLLCPTCGREMPEAPRKGRICGKCDRPIRRHDRWSFVRGKCEHLDCDDPQLAKATEAARVKREIQTEFEVQG